MITKPLRLFALSCVAVLAAVHALSPPSELTATIDLSVVRSVPSSYGQRVLQPATGTDPKKDATKVDAKKKEEKNIKADPKKDAKDDKADDTGASCKFKPKGKGKPADTKVEGNAKVKPNDKALRSLTSDDTDVHRYLGGCTNNAPFFAIADLFQQIYEMGMRGPTYSEDKRRFLTTNTTTTTDHRQLVLTRKQAGQIVGKQTEIDKTGGEAKELYEEIEARRHVNFYAPSDMVADEDAAGVVTREEEERFKCKRIQDIKLVPAFADPVITIDFETKATFKKSIADARDWLRNNVWYPNDWTSTGAAKTTEELAVWQPKFDAEYAKLEGTEEEKDAHVKALLRTSDKSDLKKAAAKVTKFKAALVKDVQYDTKYRIMRIQNGKTHQIDVVMGHNIYLVGFTPVPGKDQGNAALFPSCRSQIPVHTLDKDITKYAVEANTLTRDWGVGKVRNMITRHHTLLERINAMRAPLEAVRTTTGTRTRAELKQAMSDALFAQEETDGLRAVDVQLSFFIAEAIRFESWNQKILQAWDQMEKDPANTITAPVVDFQAGWIPAGKGIGCDLACVGGTCCPERQ